LTLLLILARLIAGNAVVTRRARAIRASDGVRADERGGAAVDGSAVGVAATSQTATGRKAP
jgi:hypothetical protein